MKQLTNHHTQPIVLASGVVLAAAGSKGSTRQVESVDDADRRRYVDRGLIVASDVEVEPTVDRRPIADKPVAEKSAAAAAKPEKESK